MIRFRRAGIIERVRCLFSPARRAKRDQAMRDAIRWLIEHPEAPCMIEGEIVPDGYGRWAVHLDSGYKSESEKQ